MNRRIYHTIRWVGGIAFLFIASLIHAQSTAERADDTSSTAQDTQSSTVGGLGGSSLLDDLLNPSGPTQATESVDTSVEGIPLVESSHRALADQLTTILQQMQSAAEQMNAPRMESDSKLEVLASQNRVIEELDRILNSIQKKTSSQSTSSEQQPESVPNQSNAPKDLASASVPSEEDSSPQTGGDRKEPKADNPEKSTDEQNSTNTEIGPPNAQNQDQQANSVVSGLPTGETIVELLDSIEQSGLANWGKLPQRLREKMSSQKSLAIPKGYEQEVHDYYKYLNESVRK